MNKTWTFICGIVIGVILTFIGLGIYSSHSRNSSDEVVYFDKPKEAIKEKSFKVFQVLEPGVALVNGETRLLNNDDDDDEVFKTYFGPIYMLVNDDDKYYSDDEIISVKSDEEARKIGILNYKTKGDLDKTVSIIKIIKKQED
jgi:hypothetical protein